MLQDVLRKIGLEFRASQSHFNAKYLIRIIVFLFG